MRVRNNWGDEVEVPRLAEREVIRLEFPSPRAVSIYVDWETPGPNRYFRAEIGVRGAVKQINLARGVHVLTGRIIRVVAVNRETFGTETKAIGWAAPCMEAPSWAEFDPLAP